jgi:hypothetical protein
MLTEIRQIKSNPREWRRFGWAIGSVLLVLGLWLAWREGAGSAWCLGVGLLLMMLAGAAPHLLRWPHLVWMAVGLWLGTLVSTVFLGIFYLMVLTPIAIIARLAGKDFLQLKLDRRRSCYWHMRDPSAPKDPARYEKQF